MLENLAPTKGFAQRILALFAEKPWLGLVVPPVVHISYPTLGSAWFANKARAIEVAKMLRLNVELDETTPVAAYGTMFWFRPAALKKLFAHRWKWEDFNAEPNHSDGGLAHVLERLISYTAQDAGFVTMQTLSEQQASLNYGMLEYKLEKISSFMPWNFPWQLHMLKLWQQAGNPVSPFGQSPSEIRKFAESGLRTDSVALAHERIEAKTTNVLQKLCGVKPISYVPSQPNRPDLRSERHKIIARVHEKLYPRFGLVSRSLDRIATSDAAVSEFLHAISAVDRFLTLTRNDNGRRLEKRARKFELLDYFLFGWWEERELTPLFNSSFYVEHNLDQDVPFNPFAHYLVTGAHQGASPHPLFDPAFYVSQVHNRVVQNPLVDYLKYGWKEHLSPHPVFDVGFYLSENPDVASHKMEPLSHYLLYGAAEGRNPHWAFDTRHYLNGSPEAVANDINPLVHFIIRGAKQGISPNPKFDVASYLESFPDVAKSGENPLIHWIQTVRQNLRDLSQK